MLRMLIADDERAIRESICHEIDWAQLGIEVIGLCRNGVEAYDMILDEDPDIVLTDIKMPGLSGLELIARVKQAHLDAEFVILSGYAEFEFAKEAMRWGVRHYLLKPTQPEQILSIMADVRRSCYRRRRAAHQGATPELLFHSLLTEAVAGGTPLEELIARSRPYLDFDHTNYELCFFYYLEPEHREHCAARIQQIQREYARHIPLTLIYVNHALIFFFESVNDSYDALDLMMGELAAQKELGGMEYKRQSFDNLRALLIFLVPRLMRFKTVDLIHGETFARIHNDSGVLHLCGKLTQRLATGSEQEREEAFSSLRELIDGAADAAFLRQMCTNVLVKYATLCGDSSALPDIMHIEALGEDALAIRAFALERLDALAADRAQTDLVAQIKRHVRQNLSNPDLSLKWLAENVLFMNVDYLSKQFSQRTGEKFSAYLTRKRMERAKELLLLGGDRPVYEVASEVGCGNNPQYFSQIFRRSVGVTPTEFVRRKGEV